MPRFEENLSKLEDDLKIATSRWSGREFFRKADNSTKKNKIPTDKLHLIQLVAACYQAQVESKLKFNWQIYQRNLLFSGRKSFVKFHYDRLKEFREHCDNCNFEDYYNCFERSEKRFGCVIFTEDLRRVLVIVPKTRDGTPGDKYCFPKGKSNDGYPRNCKSSTPRDRIRESGSQTAFRELQEETSIAKDQVIQQLRLPSIQIKSITVDLYWRESTLFVIIVKHGSVGILLPNIGRVQREEVDDAYWMNVSELTSDTLRERPHFKDGFIETYVPMKLSGLFKHAWPEIQQCIVNYRINRDYYRPNDLPDFVNSGRYRRQEQQPRDQEYISRYKLYEHVNGGVTSQNYRRSNMRDVQSHVPRGGRSNSFRGGRYNNPRGNPHNNPRGSPYNNPRGNPYNNPRGNPYSNPPRGNRRYPDIVYPGSALVDRIYDRGSVGGGHSNRRFADRGQSHSRGNQRSGRGGRAERRRRESNIQTNRSPHYDSQESFQVNLSFHSSDENIQGNSSLYRTCNSCVQLHAPYADIESPSRAQWNDIYPNGSVFSLESIDQMSPPNNISEIVTSHSRDRRLPEQYNSREQPQRRHSEYDIQTNRYLRNDSQESLQVNWYQPSNENVQGNLSLYRSTSSVQLHHQYAGIGSPSRPQRSVIDDYGSMLSIGGIDIMSQRNNVDERGHSSGRRTPQQNNLYERDDIPTRDMRSSHNNRRDDRRSASRDR